MTSTWYYNQSTSTQWTMSTASAATVRFNPEPATQEGNIMEKLQDYPIGIDAEQAQAQIDLYATLPRLTEHEKNMLSIYDAVIKGEKFFNMEMLRMTGGRRSDFGISPGQSPQHGLPPLAVAPVTATSVTFERRIIQQKRGETRYESSYRVGRTVLYSYEGTIERGWTHSSVVATTKVPSVLPTVRDKVQPSDLIVWEATWHEQTKTTFEPVDPIVIRKVDGSIYRVVAAWDLTAVEAALLAQ